MGKRLTDSLMKFGKTMMSQRDDRKLMMATTDPARKMLFSILTMFSVSIEPTAGMIVRTYHPSSAGVKRV